jgi:hypothetical protein
VTLAGLQLAANIASQTVASETASLAGGHWRFSRILHLYLETRTIRDNMDRLHQYCRCIEGLIVSEPGQGKNRFKSRTELFIGPRHHTLMGEAYDVRSDVEHLYENKHLEVFDRAARLELVKKLEMMEYIARSTLARKLKVAMERRSSIGFGRGRGSRRCAFNRSCFPQNAGKSGTAAATALHVLKRGGWMS